MNINLINLLLLFIITKCQNNFTIEDVLKKIINSTNTDNTISDIVSKQTIKNQIIKSLNNAIEILKNNPDFISKNTKNSELINSILSQIKSFANSSNIDDLQDIIKSFQLLNELNISNQNDRIKSILANIKDYSDYIKNNNINLELPILPNLPKLPQLFDEEEEPVEKCNMDQCKLDGKCVNKIYCEKLNQVNSQSNSLYFIIFFSTALIVVIFGIYKYRKRINNTHIEYIPQVNNKEEEINTSLSA